MLKSLSTELTEPKEYQMKPTNPDHRSYGGRTTLYTAYRRFSGNGKPGSSFKEEARRQKQIAKGQLKKENGLLIVP